MRKLFRYLKRPAVTLWLSVGVLVAYILSLGPAVYAISNISLPEIAVDGYHCFYCPLALVARDSEIVGPVLIWYVYRWIDEDHEPANVSAGDWPELPPFFVEISGTLIGAWLIWNFVRWLNQRHRTAANVAPED